MENRDLRQTVNGKKNEMHKEDKLEKTLNTNFVYSKQKQYFLLAACTCQNQCPIIQTFQRQEAFNIHTSGTVGTINLDSWP